MASYAPLDAFSSNSHGSHAHTYTGVRETSLCDATCSSRSDTIHTVMAPPVGAIRSVVTREEISLISGRMLDLLTCQLLVYINFLSSSFQFNSTFHLMRKATCFVSIEKKNLKTHHNI